MSAEQNEKLLAERVCKLETELYARIRLLNNAERILFELGYERCTAEACNCSSYHRREKQ